MTTVLTVDKIDVFHGDLQALWEVSLEVNAGEVVTIIGSNSAGKTTLLKTIAGFLKPRRGDVTYQGTKINSLPPNKIVELGISYIPAEKELFPKMSIIENLEMGAYSKRARKQKDRLLNNVFELFPVLRERRRQKAGTLSGGQQQMLALGRGLMSKASVIMLDEPSTGLAPTVAQELFEAIKKIKEEKFTIMLVEQHITEALSLADRGYVLENGRIILSGKGSELMENPMIKVAYLGG